ncbi:hypothetical protein C8039_05765 [Halogeometricum sp. wsp3]|nr:hypothetical protein C8039_05765 [Halogeometricum sp. wsp3]
MLCQSSTSPGWPVYHGNRRRFMRDLEAEIEARRVDSSQGMAEKSTSANGNEQSNATTTLPMTDETTNR